MVWNGYVNYGKQDGGKAKETAPKWSGEWLSQKNKLHTKCGGFDKLNHRNTNLFDSRELRSEAEQ